ncbi:MAG: hypothetical protein WC974_09750 [Thermoplasmata archaeon]
MDIGREPITINSLDELLDLVSEELEDGFNEGKKLSQICLELGIKDTMNLLDERTVQLIELQEHYVNAPHMIDNMIFFDANRILNQYKPRMF